MDGGEITITLVKPDSGTPVPSGSMPFVSNGLNFHTLGSEKFTVTYSIHATAKELTEGPGAEESDEENRVPIFNFFLPSSPYTGEMSEKKG